MAEQIGLYVHFPFCQHKCGYCDFNSYTLDLPRRLPDQLAALHGEIDLRAQALDREVVVTSVFFGGGTPTLYEGEALASVLTHLRARFPFASEVEVTVEANPGTVDERQLATLVAAGVDRVSFGAQSFHADELRRLERIHSADDVRRAVAMARRAGVRRLNLDLLYGLPEQTWPRLKASLEAALELEPDHLSLYALELEPGTRFGRLYRRGELTLPDEEEVVAMGEAAEDVLSAAGLLRYEVSNYARPGQECRHNLHTWRRGAYLGFGPGAHSFLPERRFWNVRSPAAHQRLVRLGRLPEEDGEDVSGRRLGEWLYLRLRLVAGVPWQELRASFGAEAERQVAAVAGELAAVGLLEMDDVGFRTTRRGRWLLNQVTARFLAP